MSFDRIRSLFVKKTTILLVDVQNSEINEEHKEKNGWYCHQIMEVCLPNMKKSYSDGRDRSLDHKCSDIFIKKNSYEGKIIDQVAPHEDDIWLKKTSSGVFNLTNIDYILRNLGIEYLVIMGMLTDQCIDSAIRDAADKGYQVICISDACTTHTFQRHENALNAFKGYCTILNTEQFIKRIKECNMDPRCKDVNSINTNKFLMSPIEPMSLTTLVRTDLIGITRGRSVPTESLDDYCNIGCGWVPADSALTPQNIIASTNPWGSHGDLRLLPSINSRVRINNGPDKDAEPFDFIHCDLIETDGRSWDCCPRTLLKKEIERCENIRGMKILTAFEHEFTLTGEKSLLLQPSFSLRAQRQQNQFGSWLMSALEAGNVQPEMFLPEFGDHQYEVTCRPTDGLSAADRAVNVREIARQMNLNASFCPLISVNGISNGVHLHLSIRDLNDQPLFYEEGRRYDLSTVGEHWAAGVIHHLPSLCALTAPTPVSYLRLKPHHWSAAYACLGFRNREAALRICPTVTLRKKSVGEQYNLEYRAMDGTASPHLALAAILIAGRLGIQQKLNLKSITDIDPHELNQNQRQDRDIRSLPNNLNDALQIFQNDKQFLEVFPRSLIETYFAVKREELSLTNQFDDNTLCQHYSKIY